MQGSLTTTSVVDLCLRLAGEAVTGTLVLSTDGGVAELSFVEGRLSGGRVPGAPRGSARLGERLVAVGRLETHDLDAVLAEQEAGSATTPLGQRLVERGLVSADAVRLGLQEQALDALQVVAGWSEGSFRLDDPAPTAGVRVSMPVERALREAARRPDDHPEPALQPVGRSADRGNETPSREEFDLFASPTTGARPVSLTDDGWADRVDTTPPTPDEPEPWVGWANGARHAEPLATPSAPAAAETAAPAARTEWPSTPADTTDTTDAPQPGSTASPYTPTGPTLPLDADTRRELFSELHEMGRPSPARDQPTPPPTPQVQPSPAEPEAEVDDDEVEIPPPAPPPPPLSRSDVSELLAELHALNLDDDDRG